MGGDARDPAPGARGGRDYGTGGERGDEKRRPENGQRQTDGAVRVARASGARGSGEKGAGLKGSIHGRVTHERCVDKAGARGKIGGRKRKRKRHAIARSAARRRKGSG